MDEAGFDSAYEFLGTHEHSVDTKGRVVLPAAYRENLEEGLVMTIGINRCLTVHPETEWRRYREGLRKLKTTNAAQRQFSLMTTSQAHRDTPDRQGRITIPARLRDYAGIDKEVCVVGADTRVEIWDRARWEAFEAEARDALASTSESFDVDIF